MAELKTWRSSNSLHDHIVEIPDPKRFRDHTTHTTPNALTPSQSSLRGLHPIKRNDEHRPSLILFFLQDSNQLLSYLSYIISLFNLLYFTLQSIASTFRTSNAT
ncbi:hypothetical protein O181_022561 [Austropuccinia psidii MF-1]|uniref:Uncharacterized protein n=1 Tax=Austropuccinia psidii MF-1 TaxID=1389203 RepID=A0A9Q3GWT5_9BASI|nr:hypothetical protein [Austropuccinia psidii MF-1]